VRIGDEEPERRLDTLARAVGEEDGLGIGGDAVTRPDEVGHGLPHEEHPFAVGVGAEAVLRLAQDAPGHRHRVVGERAGGHPLDELGVLGQRDHLPNPGERALLQRLWIADVAVDDLAALALELLGAGHDGAPDGVLRLAHVAAQLLQSYRHASHPLRRSGSARS